MTLKALDGRAERAVAASPDAVYEVLADVARWPDWYPAVRSVEVAGERVHVRAQMLGMPLSFQADVRRGPPQTVEVERVPYDEDDAEELRIVLSVQPEPAGSRVAADFSARVDVPRLLPLPGGVGDRVADGLLSALAEHLA
jgi:hypothetical protein